MTTESSQMKAPWPQWSSITAGRPSVLLLVMH